MNTTDGELLHYFIFVYNKILYVRNYKIMATSRACRHRPGLPCSRVATPTVHLWRFNTSYLSTGKDLFYYNIPLLFFIIISVDIELATNKNKTYSNNIYCWYQKCHMFLLERPNGRIARASILSVWPCGISSVCLSLLA